MSVLAGAISGNIKYWTSVISDAQATNIAETFCSALRTIIESPDNAYSDMGWLSSTDRQTVAAWNSAPPALMEACVHTLIEEQTRASPEAPAITSWDGELTYRELNDLSDRLATHLTGQLGVGPGTIVPLCFVKSMWAVVAMLAVLKTGAACVPMVPDHPDAHLAGIIEDTGARVVLVSEDLQARFAGLAQQPVAVGVSTSDWPVPDEDDDIKGGSGTIVTVVGPSDLAVVIFTSGSTGRPKGVLLEHGALSTSIAAHGEALQVGRESRVLQFAAFSFDISLQDIFTTLTRGGCICMPSESARLSDLAGVMNSMKVNWAGLTPTVAALLQPKSVPDLKTLVLAGEAVTSQIIETWGEAVKLHNCYGPAESTIYCAWQGELGRGRGRHPADIGKALAATLWVADATDHNRPAPVGVVGELLVQGPTLARGYLNNEEQTSTSFVPLPSWVSSLQEGDEKKNPWNRVYRTGDLVRYNQDGSLVFLGRRDTQVKVRGQRLELSQVEHAIRTAFAEDVRMECPNVAVDAVRREESSRGQVLIAFLEQSSGVTGGGEEGGGQDEGKAPTWSSEEPLLPAREDFANKCQLLKANLTARLPPYMIPQVFIPISQMPLTSSGKVNRRRLQEIAKALDSETLAGYSRASGAEKRKPSTHTEMRLQTLWESLLCLSPGSVGADDSFFQLGADSVDAMRLVAAASEAGMTTLTVRQVFLLPQLSQLAAELDANEYEHVPVPGATNSVQPFELLGEITVNEQAALVAEVADHCGVELEAIEDTLPCTPLQEGLMALASRQPGAYMAQHVFRLSSQVQPERLKAAWAQTVQECDILRTRMVYVQGRGSLQVVLRGQVEWNDEKETSVAAAAGLQEFLVQDRREPMSYNQPLSRVAIVSGGVDEENPSSLFLVWTAHHAIYDGWSIGIVMQLVEQAYRGSSDSPGTTAPILSPTPFSSFIKHLRTAVDGPDGLTGDDYWRRQLDGWSGAPFPKLPTATHQAGTNSSARHSFLLPDSSLTTRTTSGGVLTQASLLRASWASVISAQTGSEDVIFGSTLSGRNAPVPNISQMVGPTITTVPLRVQFRADSTVEELLQRVQQESLDMIPYEQAGLHHIRLLSSDAQAACEFQSLMAVQPAGGRGQLRPDYEPLLTPQVEFANSAGFHAYPLVIECRPDGTRVGVEAQYDDSVLSAWEVQRLLKQFEHVVRQFTQSKPGDLIGEVVMFSPEDETLVRGWNAPLPAAVEACVHVLIEEQVYEHPGAAAVASWDGQLTYGELDEVSSRLAAHLQQLGAGHQTPILICLEKSKWVIIAALAVLKVGGTFIPLDSEVPAGRLQQIAQAAEAKFAIGSPQKCGLLSTAMATVVEVSPIASSSWPSPMISAVTEPTDIAYIMFTSGSTGKPKGVMMEHQAISSSIKAHGRAMNFGRDTRALHFSSLGFDASIAEIFTTLVHGGCVCIPDEDQRLTNITGFINQLQVNWAFFTPSVINLYEPSQVPHLKTLVLGGEPMKKQIVDVWADEVDLIHAYGPTEVCVYCVSTTLKRGQSSQSDVIGVAIGSTAWVVSLKSEAQLAAVGSVGELWMESPQLARGYLNNQEATDKSFVTSPKFLQGSVQAAAKGRKEEHALSRRLYRTGDLVRYNEEGMLRFVGRKDAQVKVRGQRVELAEIEHEIYAVKQVEACVVLFPKSGPLAGKVTAVASLSRDDDGEKQQQQHAEDSGGERTTVCGSGLMLLRDTQLDAARLRILNMQPELVNALPSFMVPTAWLTVESLPLSASGKLDRVRVMNWVANMTEETAQTGLIALDDEAGMSLSGNAASAVTPTERVVQQATADALGLAADQISMARSFVNHGGDSISAMQLASRCRAKRLRVSVQDILRSRSLSQLALLTTALKQSSVSRDEAFDTIFDLSPIQQLYFELEHTSSNSDARFNQSFFVRLTRRKDVSEVARAVETLVRQHSMLRARLCTNDSGYRQQMVTSEVQGSVTFRARSVPRKQAAELMASVIAETQSRINPHSGPIFAVDLFDVEETPPNQGDQGGGDSNVAPGQLLFMVAHHLVIDLVSWRILLQQLEELLETGELLAERPVPFQNWTKLQRDYAERKLTPRVALPYTLPSNDLSFWDIKGENVWGDVDATSFSLSEAVTDALLGVCNRAFNTETLDLLTAALLYSFSQAFAEREVPTLFSESHGRETWDADIDLSGTVGWFTTLRPITVPISRSDNVMDVVRQAKEVRHNTPSNGWAYFASRFLHPDGRKEFGMKGPVEILFNYLGQFQHLEQQEALLQQEPRVGGFAAADMGPDTPRMAVIDVSASVNKGRMNFTFAFSNKTPHTARIVDWTERCKETLVSLAEVLSQRDREFTTSDLPLLKLTPAGLQQLVKRQLPSIGIENIHNVEDIYPCSQMQHGMLVSQTKAAELYQVDFSFEAVSPDGSAIDIERLKEAWQTVVNRHAILRTVFLDGATLDGMFAQVVLRHVEATIIRSKVVGDPVSTTAESGTDARSGIGPGVNKTHPSSVGVARPAHCFVIEESADGRVECRLEINHALVDGASVPIVFGDLARAYGHVLPVTPGPLYRDYIAYLASYPKEAAVDYWAEHLAGVEPCHFPRLAATGASEAQVALATVDLDLSHLAADVQSFCAANNVTVSNLIHTAWAILLRTYTGSDDVCFGYLASGRDIPVQGVEDTVGPFINILTARLAVTADTTVAALVSASKESHMQALPHQSCSLAQIHHALGISGQSLFNTAVSLQAYASTGTGGDGDGDGDASQQPGLCFRSKGGRDPTEVRFTESPNPRGRTNSSSFRMKYTVNFAEYTHADFHIFSLILH